MCVHYEQLSLSASNLKQQIRQLSPYLYCYMLGPNYKNIL